MIGLDNPITILKLALDLNEVNPITNEYYSDLEKYDLSYSLTKPNDPDLIYDDIMWFQNKLSDPELSKFQRKAMVDGLEESQMNLKKFLIYS